MDIKNNRSARIMNKKYTSGKSESLLEVVVVVVVVELSVVFVVVELSVVFVVVELSVVFVVVVDCHAVSAEFDSYPSGQELTHVKLCKSRGLVQEVHVVRVPEQVAHIVHDSQDPDISTSPLGHDVTHVAPSSIYPELQVTQLVTVPEHVAQGLVH